MLKRRVRGVRLEILPARSLAEKHIKPDFALKPRVRESWPAQDIVFCAYERHTGFLAFLTSGGLRRPGRRQEQI